MCKLELDLSTGKVIVEGSEELIKLIYNDIRERMFTLDIKKEEVKKVIEQKNDVISESNLNKVSGKKSQKGSKPSKANTPNFVKDLNLRQKGLVSLKDYFNAYVAKNNAEIILVITKYLNEIINIEEVTIDHIYTCYRELSIKVPKALYQIVINAKNEKGWFDIYGDIISVTIQGDNYFIHDFVKSGEQVNGK